MPLAVPLSVVSRILRCSDRCTIEGGRSVTRNDGFGRQGMKQ